MNYENQILDVLLQIMAWDISDEQLGNAINDQAKLMSGIPPEDLLEGPSEIL